jgi:DNA helicase HerA-like ATPase
MGGRFEARLRDHRTVVRSTKTREGEISLSNSVAVLEAKFDFKVLDRLHKPSFVGIERVTSEGSQIYLIYEIVNLKPTHFQMLGMDVSLPKTVRLEFLTRINESWGESEETWLDIMAVPTGYLLEVEGGEPRFAKTTLIPLIGSRAYLLSNYTVRKFLCVDGGVPIGTLIGFDMPLTVDIESIVRYHAGIFGFTGSGKSNLASYLIRKAVEAIPDLKVVVFDVAGEYPIHLLDLLTTNGVVYSTEDFQGDVSNFINAQAIPETLEERLPESVLKERVKRLFEESRVQKIVVEDSGELKVDLNFILTTLENIYKSGRAGAPSANLKLKEITQYLIEGKGYDRSTDIAELRDEDREYLIQTLEELADSAPDRSSLKTDLTTILNYLKEPERSKGSGGAESRVLTPSALANQLLRSDQPTLNILYLPDPDKARLAAAKLINTLLYVKKTRGARRKVLIVLDEAQEFIPDRAIKTDYSDDSNRAVETLLRQGRKYRAHCWLSTQRVAHLNVNALQQLHSYFVSTLPRLYDRIVIADAFSLSYDILEKTTELDTGQWLFVSYKATKQKSVPAFIQSPNNEDILLANLGIK